MRQCSGCGQVLSADASGRRCRECAAIVASSMGWLDSPWVVVFAVLALGLTLGFMLGIGAGP